MPTSFGPCCVNCACASCDEKASAPKIRTKAPKNLACDIDQSHAVIPAPVLRWSEARIRSGSRAALVGVQGAPIRNFLMTFQRCAYTASRYRPGAPTTCQIDFSDC